MIFSGRGVFHEHVKEYKLAFSNDGSNFLVYLENGKEKVSLKRQNAYADFDVSSVVNPFYTLQQMTV